MIQKVRVFRGFPVSCCDDAVRGGRRSFRFLQKALLLMVMMSFVSVSQAEERSAWESLLWRTSVATTLALVAYTNAAGADAITGEMGVDSEGEFNVVRAGLQWDWNDNLLELGGWQLDSYWQLEFSKWQSVTDNTQVGVNVTAGIIPMFRFQSRPAYVRPYVAVGVGLNVFTDSKLESYEFGSNFQFSDVMVLGMNIGTKNQWGIAYKFQHYSNGSVRPPNSGINLSFLTLTYNY
jgi:lipid A 3-O-deacylase